MGTDGGVYETFDLAENWRLWEIFLEHNFMKWQSMTQDLFTVSMEGHKTIQQKVVLPEPTIYSVFKILIGKWSWIGTGVIVLETMAPTY